MPKMKTNRGAKKRFRLTGSGKVRRASAGLSHMMMGKSDNRRRKLRKRFSTKRAEDSRCRVL